MSLPEPRSSGYYLRFKIAFTDVFSLSTPGLYSGPQALSNEEHLRPHDQSLFPAVPNIAICEMLSQALQGRRAILSLSALLIRRLGLRFQHIGDVPVDMDPNLCFADYLRWCEHGGGTQSSILFGPVILQGSGNQNQRISDPSETGTP